VPMRSSPVAGSARYSFFDALSQLVEGGQRVFQQCGAEDRRLGAMTIAVEQVPTDLSFEV